MPTSNARERAQRAERAGRSKSTQTGEFIREEVRGGRRGTPGTRSTRQAIAFGLAQALRPGVDLPPPAGRIRPRTQHPAADRGPSRGRSARQAAGSRAWGGS